MVAVTEKYSKTNTITKRYFNISPQAGNRYSSFPAWNIRS